MFKNYAFIAGALCQSGDRFLRTGYKESALTVQDVIRLMAARGLARGVEIHHRGGEDESTARELCDLMAESFLVPTFVNTWLYGERVWRFGSLSAADSSTRRDAVKRCKGTIDYARQLNAMGVSLWLGQDGFDYAFQTDYKSQWENLIESLKEICDYADGLPIALEPKPREPRNRSLIDNVQTALFLRMKTERENLGITLDTGHVLAGGQGLGASLTLAMQYGTLYNLHINDNYGAWDDDMIVGSVHLNEQLETFYLLKKHDYQGYISVDIFPYREDAVGAVEESILCMMDYDRIIEKLGIRRIDELIAGGDILQTLREVRGAVFSR